MGICGSRDRETPGCNPPPKGPLADSRKLGRCLQTDQGHVIVAKKETWEGCAGQCGVMAVKADILMNINKL